MTSELDSREGAGDRARARAYLRDFVPAMAGYVIVVAAVLTWGGIDGHSHWRFLWAMLPLLPTLWIVRAVWRHLARIDDYQRLLLLRSLAGGFAGAMLAAITMGLLGAAGLPVGPTAVAWIVFGAGMIGWAGGGVLATRR